MKKKHSRLSRGSLLAQQRWWSYRRLCCLTVMICCLVSTLAFVLDWQNFWTTTAVSPPPPRSSTGRNNNNVEDDAKSSMSTRSKNQLLSPSSPFTIASSRPFFPTNLESAVRTYTNEHNLAHHPTTATTTTTTRKTGTMIWQTWREPDLSPAVETKWDQFLQAHPSLERQVVTDLHDVFTKLFVGTRPNDNDDGDSSYYNRTVARLVPGAARADVWRYATLYYYGGIYIDADSTLVGGSALSLLERWFSTNNQSRIDDPPVPILSHEGHNWRRQYVSRCKGIWQASNLTLPETYDRSVLQWMLIFPFPRHPILWQALHLVDRLIAAASHWDTTSTSSNNDPQQEQQQEPPPKPAFSLADKVLCVTGPVVFTVAVHSVLESYPHLAVHWEGIDYNGQALFKDPAATPDELHYQNKAWNEATTTTAPPRLLLMPPDVTTTTS